MVSQAKHQNFIRKLIGSKLFLLLIVFILIALTISVGRESYHKYQLTKEINQLKSEIGRLEKNGQHLADLLEYFGEESYLEKEARLKLNLQKPGEKLVIISGEENGQLDQGNEFYQGEDYLTAPGDSQRDLSQLGGEQTEINFWKWWEYFFAP